MTTPTEQESVDADPLIGQTLANRYQIELRLGEGAMGSVYRAKHIKVGRPFAVKILHPKLLSDEKVALRFEREAELAGRLRHPNVIGVVDVGETTEGLRYMVMDFAEGQDLANLLSEAPMAAPRIMNLTRQILEGLFHAHEQGLIHRDFKPENVIIERDAHGHEVPRIVDFGIAILREGGDSANAQGRLTTNGLVLGTPHYMAPEQAVADPIDHRIDLFALGIVVYEMLCGKLPFDGTGAEVARANLLLDPPMIAQRVPYLEVDPLLEAFARRMMAKRRESRPPTARAAREILDLIERDRAAAAAALGVALEPAGPRKPVVTQDSMPQHAGEAPPMVAAPMQQQPVSPPLMMVSAPVAAAAPTTLSRERKGMDTAVTRPLTYGETQARSRKRIAIGLVAALLGGILAFAIIKMAGGKSEDAHDPVVAVASGAKLDDGSAAKPIVTPLPEAKPDAAVEVAAVGSDDVGSAGSDGSAETATDPTPHPEHPKKHPDKHPDKIKQPVVEHPKDPVPKDPKDGSANTPVVAPTVSVSELVTIYTAVGRDMETLRSKKGDDSISDIQPRYRLVNLQDAMSTPAKRDAAFDQLAKLQHDIRSRLK